MKVNDRQVAAEAGMAGVAQVDDRGLSSVRELLIAQVPLVAEESPVPLEQIFLAVFLHLAVFPPQTAYLV